MRNAFHNRVEAARKKKRFLADRTSALTTKYLRSDFSQQTPYRLAAVEFLLVLSFDDGDF